MKPNHLFTSMLAVTALFVTACSTPKMAQKNAIQDDVYNTSAQAKEYIAQVPMQNTPIDSSAVNDYYGTSDPRYNMDYSSRIDRFFYASPWRTYYDDYYGYNSFYSPYTYSLNGYWGNAYNNWLNPYAWNYFGSPFYNPYWGIYSNYNYFGGGYYGGYYGGGFYGNGGYVGRGNFNANYGARPSRGSENGVGRTNGTSYTGSGSISSRANNGTSNNGNVTTRSRAEMYNPNNGTTTSRSNGNSTSNTPTRSTSSDSRPTRSNDVQPPTRSSAPTPSYNPPAQSSPPPSSGGSRTESSSSGGGGGGRPGRGGK